MTFPSASIPPAALRVPFLTRGEPAVGCPGTTGCGSSISSSSSAGTTTGSGSGIAGGWNSAPRIDQQALRLLVRLDAHDRLVLRIIQELAELLESDMSSSRIPATLREPIPAGRPR